MQFSCVSLSGALPATLAICFSLYRVIAGSTISSVVVPGSVAELDGSGERWFKGDTIQDHFSIRLESTSLDWLPDYGMVTGGGSITYGEPAFTSYTIGGIQRPSIVRVPRKYEIYLIEYECSEWQSTREIKSVKLFSRGSVLWPINKRHLDGIIRNFVEMRKIFGFVSRFLRRAFGQMMW
ncbi:hypothetical protein F5146DRAFT_1006251 [Armillaria mellea]|nr:hypothetical protein F5146DRAFT_1006251 [Armillaria mellea]